jgi:outer membrane protein assembly factor BamA
MRSPKNIIIFILISFVVFFHIGLLYGYDIPGVAKYIQAKKAQEKFIKEKGDLIIKKIELTGLTKTKNEVILLWVFVKPGDKLSKFDVVTFLEDLYKLRIFSDVTISYVVEEGKVRILINITEKISFYPIPVFLYTKDTQLGGLFLVEANALGYNDGWSAGGIGSNRGWQYLVGYKNLNVQWTQYFLWLRSSGGLIYVENATHDEIVFQNYKMYRFDLQYYAGKLIQKKYSVALTGGARAIRVPRHINKNKLNPPTGGDIYNQGLRLLYDDTKNRFYYDEGLQTYVEYEYGFPISHHDLRISNLISKTRYTTPVIWDHTFTPTLSWAYSKIPDVYEHRLGGLMGSRTLPTFLVPADSYINASVNYQIPFLVLDWITFTFVAFFDLGLYQRNQDEAVGYWGPGGGTRIYLRDVSIPAFGIDCGYQLNSKDIHFSIYLGYAIEI